MKKLRVLTIIVGGALLAATPFSFQWSPEKNVVLSLDRADARVGRPGTALSVAGVHRRAYRRAYRGAVYGGVAGYGLGSYYGYSYPGSYASYGYSYPTYSYPSYSSGYSAYGYGGYYGPAFYGGYGVARRVAIHRARWR
jgi:hypothetical protein